MEDSRAVSHSKEHHEGFEKAVIGTKGHFPFISGLHTYIIEAPVDVEFCKVFSSAELRDKFGDEEESVTVVLWTSSHILYSLPLHQKGDVSKATC